MEEEIIAYPILQWAYSSNDGQLHGTIGYAKDNDPFPQPVSGDHVFTKTSSLSSN
jgi:hypothetical protein